jgi:hypothetical protein
MSLGSTTSVTLVSWLNVSEYRCSGTLLTPVVCEKIESSGTMEPCEHILKR